MQKMTIRAEAPRSKRNPIAASLRAGQFRKQVVRDRTKYARKSRNGKGWGIHIDLVGNVYTVDMRGKCAVFDSAEDALAFVEFKHQESLALMD